MPVINISTLATGNLEGAAHGATISLIFDHSEPGMGPRLHRHPYDETWVVQAGNLTFQLGDTRHNAGPGDIIIAPAGVPHKFTNDETRTLKPGLHPRQPHLQDGVAGIERGSDPAEFPPQYSAAAYRHRIFSSGG